MKQKLISFFIGTCLFFGIINTIFMYKNPLANQTVIFSDFDSVITFQKLDKYQPNRKERK